MLTFLNKSLAPLPFFLCVLAFYAFCRTTAREKKNSVIALFGLGFSVYSALLWPEVPTNNNNHNPRVTRSWCSWRTICSQPFFAGPTGIFLLACCLEFGFWALLPVYLLLAGIRVNGSLLNNHITVKPRNLFGGMFYFTFFCWSLNLVKMV